MKNNLSGRNILVMDDDPDILELFSINLAKLGCKTVLVSNGEEAINHYQHALENGNPVDAVILDLSIPGGLSGQEVASKLRSLHKDAILIVASSHTEGPEMSRFQDFGFNAAIEKNFNRDAIKRTLEQVLNSK